MLPLPLTQPTLTPGIPQSRLVLFLEFFKSKILLLSLPMMVEHTYLKKKYLCNIMNNWLWLLFSSDQGKLFPPEDRIDPRPDSNPSHPSHSIRMVLHLVVDTFSSFKNAFSPALEFLRTNPISVRWSLESPLRVRTAQQISAWSDISLLTYSVAFQYFEDETILDENFYYAQPFGIVQLWPPPQ